MNKIPQYPKGAGESNLQSKGVMKLKLKKKEEKKEVKVKTIIDDLESTSLETISFNIDLWSM